MTFAVQKVEKSTTASVFWLEDDNDLGEDNESESDGNAVTQETIVEQEKPNRTGLDRNALAELSNELKRKRATESTGALSYVARKRQSLDKYIEGAAEADEKATSDWMTMMMMLDTRTAEREVLREQREREWRTQENMRQEKALEVQRAREDRREEMHMLLLSKLIDARRCTCYSSQNSSRKSSCMCLRNRIFSKFHLKNVSLGRSRPEDQLKMTGTLNWSLIFSLRIPPWKHGS
ncbi:hypothetical protein LEN26_007202 [Aphanomyces euteiches]|nr:hypothetical protein AeMF1_003759 [Aphanomyces euteiches]KAH9133026.1 hypothetical protein LEN26_007202 [Aphanomyces euteiches]